MNEFKPNVYLILKRILSEINAQVVDHGDRVAYMFLKTAQYRGIKDVSYLRNMVIACIAHDIGAYKTEKFISLLNFDVTKTEEHCIYGYLFMKYFSPLKEFAEVLLYHHSFYNEMEKHDSKYFLDGVLIHLMDRIDIFALGHTDEEVIKQITLSKGKNFNPIDVDDFVKANEKYKILDHIRDGSFVKEMNEFFADDEIGKDLLYPIVDMLAYEIDFKSEQTVIHTITTSLFAEILAYKLGFGEEEIKTVGYAARIHDLGKIKVPTEILEKPAKLTPEEYKEIQKHVEFTYEIVNNLFPEDIVSIAVRHHERLDGSGYPYGLKKEDQSTADRVVQVADVVSALVYRRSYKNALPKEQVCCILSEQSENGKLDKTIVDLFINNYEKIVGEVQDKSKDVIERYENLQIEYNSYLTTTNILHDWKEEFPLF